MMRRSAIAQGACTAALLAVVGSACAEVKLPAVFGSNMVLQRGMKAPIWGWAAPGEKITVSMEGAKASTTAGRDGAWKAAIGPLQAGGPYTLTVAGADNTVTLDNVLVGDVWICSGQSNMEMGIAQVRNAQAEIAAANYPKIRLFTAPKVAAEAPQRDVKGQWDLCTPTTISTGGWGGFSAVAYFFGRELQKKYGVPIGLIHTSWGGTPAESWTRKEALAADPDLAVMLSRIPKPGVDIEAARRKYQQDLAAWQAQTMLKDSGNKGFAQGWASEDCDDSGWQAMKLPGAWETNSPALAIDGAVWFRRAMEIPADWAGKDLVLSLGAIDDFDTTYFNGEKVGAIGEENPQSYSVARKYTVPGRLVKAGRNIIAVRVFDRFGGGGFTGQPQDMALALAGGTEKGLPLDGAWRFKVEFARNEKDLKPQPQEPAGVWNSWTPSGLYNAMIAPIIPYGIKGAIWYQGESNAGRAYQYRKLFPAMITNWRRDWKQGNFPFFWVQLANYTERNAEPVESDWAELREAQTMTLSLPKTGMAVIIDIGEGNDIHPKNKQDVGKRLALAAMNVAYGDRSVEGSSPLFKAMTRANNMLTLTFSHSGGGFVTGDGRAATGFAIAGEDRKFYWANATIEGDKITVFSPQVENPVAVRYGWSNNPDVNVYSKDGLPLCPFRTDDWPGVTVNNK